MSLTSLIGMDLVTAWPAGKQVRDKVLGYSDAGLQNLSELASTSGMEEDESMQPGEIHFLKPLPSAILGSNLPVEPGIRAVQFDMHLSTGAENKTHIYTSIHAKDGSSPRNLEQVVNWQAKFPELALKYKKNRIGCPIFLFESRLRLIDEIRLGRTSLGIEFMINFTGGSHFNDWRSFTRVHKQGFVTQDFDKTEFEKNPWDKLECGKSDEQYETRLMIPFKSKWWVKLFSSVIAKSVEARRSNDRDNVKWADEYPSAYLRDLSIMQEIWATPRTNTGARALRQMAVLLWTFGKARNGEAAATTWRPLIFSSTSPFQIQEPIIPALRPPMSLESALRSTTRFEYQSERPHLDQYCSGEDEGLCDSDHQILVGPNAKCETDTATLILDYQSFPSSTSTSFPSSISSSTYPPHHGSSFDSQDSCYQSNESSFPSYNDHSDYHLHDNDTLKSQPASASAYEFQDSIYDSSPPSAHDNIISFDPFDNLEHDGEPTLIGNGAEPNFLGGAAPLVAVTSGTDGKERQERLDRYEAPIIAPRASIIPQQHLAHQLELFERWVSPAASLNLASPEDYGNPPMTDLASGEHMLASDEGVDKNNNSDGIDIEGDVKDDDDRRLADYHSQQQQQLEYFNEAAQYWQQQSLHQAPFSNPNMIVFVPSSNYHN